MKRSRRWTRRKGSNPTCTSLRRTPAEILVLRGRTGEGLALFRETARAAPGDPWVPLRAAWALLASGRYAEIPSWIEESERALKDVNDEEETRLAPARSTVCGRRRRPAGPARAPRGVRGGPVAASSG